MPLEAANVLGILSLVFWSLVLVVVGKYLTFVMRADNHGEGGILALLALLKPKHSSSPGKSGLPKHSILLVLGLFGAALLYGDGMITPAMSVLSAVEGLEYAPNLSINTPIVVGITVIILFVLFAMQRRGTHCVGRLFGPIMLLWFVTIAALGVVWICKRPEVLKAVNPWYGFAFFAKSPKHGFFLLGAVVLCITGGEALYADMGHFGKKPIRTAWYLVVFPALVLNYFGQGALLLNGSVKNHPFYDMVSGAWTYPLVGLATMAAVIASQALISGAFSLTQQAVQLGYLPRINIVHTSGEAHGQIYVPEINQILMISCIALVLVFQKATHLADAYGIAVTGTMAITSLLFYRLVRLRWQWHWLPAMALVSLFMVIDGAFLGSNITKIASGGWVPLAVAGVIFAIMTTWKRGRALIEKADQATMFPLDDFLHDLEHNPVPRVPGTAIFMSRFTDRVPAVLLHHVKHNKVLHEQVILLSVVTERVPEVPVEKRLRIQEQRGGFYRVTAHYGFMQNPRVAEILKLCHKAGLKTLLNETSYYLGRETLRTSGNSHMPRWRKTLFSFLTRNARSATEFFGIPPNRVIELGTQIEL